MRIAGALGNSILGIFEVYLIVAGTTTWNTNDI